MKIVQTTVDDVLRIWENQYGQLSPAYRRSFKANPLTKEIASFSQQSIEKAIRYGDRRYLNELLNYLKLVKKAETYYDRPEIASTKPLKDIGTSRPVSTARSCGHRYQCTCLEVFPVLHLARQAA